MSQLSLSIDSSLLVRDITGDYRPANADEVLHAAQRILGAQLRGREVLTSPQAVRDFLRVKLGGLEHEVFAVLMLDAQNRHAFLFPAHAGMNRLFRVAVSCACPVPSYAGINPV